MALNLNAGAQPTMASTANPADPRLNLDNSTDPAAILSQIVTTLATPNIYPDIPVFTPPQYSGDTNKGGTGTYTGQAAALNTFLTAAVAAGRNAVKSREAPIYCDAPINVPANFDLVGLGRAEHGAKGEAYAGGVKLIGPYGGGTPALQLVGTGPAQTVSTTGLINARVQNISFAGNYANADVFGRTTGPVPLVLINQGYKVVFACCSFVADYGQVLRIINTWDSAFYDITIIGGGCCDPTVTADSSTVQGYTGRSFMGVETAIGRSLGVPAVEIISPNAFGGDVCNNIDFLGDLHREANGTNGTGFIMRGGNGNNNRFGTGSKMECDDGCNPLLVWQDQSQCEWNGLIYGSGAGTAPNTVGSIAGGTPWKNYGNPGLVLLHNCTSPRITGAIGYDGYGGGSSQATAPLTAFVRCINTIDPQINVGIESGLDSLIAGSGGTGGARLILDGCTDVSTLLTRVYATAYVKGLAGTHGTVQERTTINGTTTVT